MKVEGYASTTDLDLVRDIVAAGAFDASIRDRGLTGPRGIRLLWQHDRSQILGSITDLKTTNNGLRITADIDESITVAAEAAKMIRAAGGLSFSVGFRTLDADITATGDIIITRGDLKEVSVVTFPANENAIMTAFKSGNALEDIATSIRELKAITTTRNPVDEVAANARRLTALLKGN